MKKNKQKRTAITIIIIVAAIAIITAIVFIFADHIVVDECASPCGRNPKKGDVCITSCRVVTLRDVLNGNY